MPRVGYGCWLRRLLGAYVVGLRVWWGRLESHSPVSFWESEMLVVLYVRDARAWICAGRLFWGGNGNSQKHVCNGSRAERAHCSWRIGSALGVDGVHGEGAKG